MTFGWAFLIGSVSTCFLVKAATDFAGPTAQIIGKGGQLADILDRSTELDMSGIGDVAAAISTLAWIYDVTVAAEPVDAFANATARLCDLEVTFDHTERLLLGLARGGFVTDEQRFTLHAAYLQQQAGLIRSAR